MTEIKLKQILRNQTYNLSYFKKFVSLEIDGSKKKSQINKEIKVFFYLVLTINLEVQNFKK